MQTEHVPVSSLLPRRLLLCLPLCAGLGLGGCSPYPDDGEFLAGVVYAQGFLAGVKSVDRLGAVGAGRDAAPVAPYTVFATTRSADTTAKVGSRAADGSQIAATTPFWSDGKRKPLSVETAGRVFVFDGPCRPTRDEPFDERLDLIRWDRQYPVFADIPEVLSANGGKPGRTANYSAVVQVVHLSLPADFPCQSIKRFDTAAGRVGQDLTEVKTEYRLLQIVDPALTPSTPPPAPLPVQLGFFNQLVVPYIDMGPVPIGPDGQTFVTMPLYKVYKEAAPGASTKPLQIVVGGLPYPDNMPWGKYSPICEERTLVGQSAPLPPNIQDPAFAAAKATGALASCLVCQTSRVDETNTVVAADCPFSQSQVTGP